MGYPLEGIRAKLARAGEHLETLEFEIAEFRRLNENRVGHQIDHQAKCVVAGVQLAKPSLRLGILAGEAIQQYRSALDHLAYQLAILRRPDASGPNFPIYTDHSVWTKKVGSRRESPKDRYLAAFRPDDFALVERLQPFDSPTHALAVIQRLSNFDKHETIHVGFVVARSLTISPLIPDISIQVLYMALPAGALQDGTELARYRVLPLKPEVKVDTSIPIDQVVKVGLTIGVRFGDESDIGLEQLAQRGNELVGIVDEFERSVPELRSA